ncbi:hypothetical protein D3C77_576120 [compost metagenome]
MFGGHEDQLATFLRRGYWYCWDPKENKEIPQAAQNLFPKMKAGDRIAVKKMLGTGSRNIAIRAIGVITEVELNEWRVYVRWLVDDLQREVPIKGCMGSIHGPFEPSDWRDSVFSI